MSEKPSAGIVGVGLLGSAVAGVLIDGGYQVFGYDTAAERLDALGSRGGHPAGSPAEVARRAEAVFTTLPTLESVEKAIAGANGVLDGSREGTAIIQMSTISPSLASQLEAVARERGAAFLDAPVSGTSSMVARRDCVITVGGERSAFERSRPILEAIARRVFHVGRCGMGSHVKLVTNLIMGLNSVAIAEGLTLAHRAGLDLHQLLEILSEGAAASKMLEVRGPRVVQGQFDPMMKIDLFLKDIHLIIEASRTLHVPLPLTGVMQQLYTAAIARGQGKEDLAAIASVYEAIAGLPARTAKGNA